MYIYIYIYIYLYIYIYIYGKIFLSPLPGITLTGAKPRVTTWLPLEPFWFRLRPVLGNTGYDLDPFDGVFVATIEPFWFRLRPVLRRTGYDLDPVEGVLVATMATLRTFGYDLGPVTDNVGSNPRRCAGVLAPTWFRPWPCVGSFGGDLSPLCGRSGSHRGPMRGVSFPTMVRLCIDWFRLSGFVLYALSPFVVVCALALLSSTRSPRLWSSARSPRDPFLSFYLYNYV